ncbi:MAG: PEP-CTERM sorting domain-containing protein [Trichloromonas sp.]|jgi:hypothetical protein|nr:PEP-CTERM sorting domain-containing protein [Trichloromonas sp.]
MKKIVLLITVLLLWVGQGWALTYEYEGTLSSANGGLFATQSWDDFAEFSWDIDYNISNAGYWTYNYSWETNAKDLSHIIVQVFNTFLSSNIKTGTTTPYELNTFTATDQGASNPGIPAPIFGLKFTPQVNTTSHSFSIVTDRAPMWGNVYAKDGKTGGNDVYAYNTGFNLVPPVFDPFTGVSLLSEPAFDPNVVQYGPVFTSTSTPVVSYGWALVPDTESGGGGGGGGIPVVPEPGTFILVGAGLVGLALLRRKQGR